MPALIILSYICCHILSVIVIFFTIVLLFDREALLPSSSLLHIYTIFFFHNILKLSVVSTLTPKSTICFNNSSVTFSNPGIVDEQSFNMIILFILSFGQCEVISRMVKLTQCERACPHTISFSDCLSCERILLY